ncbi:hypothetical protein DXG01_005315 [Tephrocybe rancida]|nr:hypothetical protein DXG01_005315 [Tephrocybe rancida]
MSSSELADKIATPRTVVSERSYAPDADVVFNSSDNVLFHIHRKNLETQAAAFPPSEFDTRGEVVPLTEDASTLENLFQYVYPQRHPDIELLSFEHLYKLAEAAEKYEIFGVMRNFVPSTSSSFMRQVGNDEQGSAPRPTISNQFNASDADVIFKSSDNVLFHIHRKNLETHAAAFPPSEFATNGEIVPLTEDASTLSNLFQYVYPKRPSDVELLPFEDLSKLAEAAEKYETLALNLVTRGLHICFLLHLHSSDTQHHTMSCSESLDDNLEPKSIVSEYYTHAAAFPPSEFSTNGEIVPLTEDASTLNNLFQYVYPKRPLANIELLTFEDLYKLSEAAEKYEIFGVMTVCKVCLRQLAANHPVEIFNYASKHGYSDILSIAAPFLLDIPLDELVMTFLPYLVVPWVRFRKCWSRAACEVITQATPVVPVCVCGKSRKDSSNMPNAHKLWVELGDKRSRKALSELMNVSVNCQNCGRALYLLSSSAKDLDEALDAVPKFDSFL